MTPLYIALGAAAVVGAVVYGVRRELARRGYFAPEEGTPTVVERPTLLPGNKPAVRVLYGVAAAIEESGERCAGGLRDIARILQLSSTDMDERTTKRVAAVVREHGQVVLREADNIDGG